MKKDILVGFSNEFEGCGGRYSQSLLALSLLVCTISGLMLASFFFPTGSGEIHSFDLVSPKNGATLHSSIPTLDWEPTGVEENCLDFDGNDDYVEVGDKSSLEGMSGLTINAWIKPRSKTHNDEIVKKDLVYILRVNNDDVDNTIFIIWDTGGNKQSVTVPDEEFPNDRWTMITATWDGEFIRIYRDGGELLAEEEADFVNLDSNGKSLAIGADPSGIEGFDGLIDDVRIYDRALSENEMENISRRLDVDNDNLVGWWRFDEGEGQIAHDSAGNNDGVLGSGTGSDSRDPAWSVDGVGGVGHYEVWLNGSNVENVRSEISHWKAFSSLADGNYSWRVVTVSLGGDEEASDSVFDFTVDLPVEDDFDFLGSMPEFPSGYHMRDWTQVALDYYDYVLDPNLSIDRNLGEVWDNEPLAIYDENFFEMAGYVGREPSVPGGMEGIGLVAGGSIAGADMENYYGHNLVELIQEWYDSGLGLFRDKPDDNDPIVHSGVYGYWPIVLSVILMDSYMEDNYGFENQFEATVERFYELCVGHGFPHEEDFYTYGFNWDTMEPDGRPEPMNRLGNASSVAWIEYLGWKYFGDRKYLRAASSALSWHLNNPGRYEATYLPGPIVAARMNAELDRNYDLGEMLDNIFFGSLPGEDAPWQVVVTDEVYDNSFTCAGLNGGGSSPNGGSGFYSFTIDTLHGPGWVVPVARYAPRFAEDIGKYALNAANSARFLQGVDLDWNHQDHLDWKENWDSDKLLFYESIASEDWGSQIYSPYATGDPIRSGWGPWDPVPQDKRYYEEKEDWFSDTPANLSLYMGNHVGFLGGIFSETGVEGVLKWNCLETDYFHDGAYSTYLYYNPFENEREVPMDLENGS